VPHWFGTSASWFGPPCGFRSRRHPFCRTKVTFLSLRPHFRVCPCATAPAFARHLHSPEVSCPHSATYSSRSTSPERCLPGSRCVLTLTMCFDALLPQRTPWYPFNQVRSRGSALQSFPWQRSPSPLGGASPPAISEPTTVWQTLGLLPPCTSPRLAVSKTCSSDKPAKASPSWITGAWRFRRIGIAAAAASLQGFSPSAGWSPPPRNFSTCGVSGSLGLRPPWGIPLPSLGLVGSPPTLTG
jgi:hypothetical protein